MRNSWTKTFRRLAAAAAVAGTTAFSSAMCYAQMASDHAGNPPYAGGPADWNDGDNGGTGFNAWDFSSSITFAGTYYGQYTASNFHAVDDGTQVSGSHYQSPHNDIGRAWDMGVAPGNNGTIRAGRGFKPLRVGQTVKVTVDNPSDRASFGKGYFIRLNRASRTDMDGRGLDGNICYGGYACTDPFTNAVTGAFRFEMYNPVGDPTWDFIDDVGNPTSTVDDFESADGGAVFSFTRTGKTSYEATIDPLNPAYPSSTVTGNVTAGGPINWFELTFFNTPTDLTPTDLPPPMAELQTDMYITGLMVVPEPGAISLLVLGAGTLLGVGTARRRKE